MSLHRENKKALVEALLALMLNAQHTESSDEKVERPTLDEVSKYPMEENSKEVIPLGEPLTVTISNGNNVSTTVLKLEEVEGDVCGTIVGNMTDIDEDELTVSDNLLVMFTELVRNEMLNI